MSNYLLLVIMLIMISILKFIHHNVIQFQHFKQLKDLSIKDLMVENVEEDDPNMAVNLLTVASTGNAAFLEELLRAGLDPDIGDSKEKTPLVCPCLIKHLSF